MVDDDNEIFVRCKRLANMTWDEFRQLAMNDINKMKHIIERDDYEKCYGVIPYNDPNYNEMTYIEIKARRLAQPSDWHPVLHTNNSLDRFIYITCISSFFRERNQIYGYVSKDALETTIYRHNH